ncbi:MAG: hypothetical protein IPL08_05465 [Saprospiraceae bacterium]|nr:hypothetical protein [Saprospiraceae bacterium]
MNIRETRIYDEIHTFTQKTKKMSHYFRVLLCVPIGALIIVSLGCGGCGGVKDAGKEKKVDISPKDRIDTSNATMDVVKIDTSTLIRTSLPELITFKYFNQEKNQFEQYDEYNYARKILVFKDSKTKNVIKEIDIVNENPFHAQGFKRKNESYTSNFSYFLYKKGTENKYDLREYLPSEIFDEIPNDFDFERGMASISHQYTADKYITVTYEIFWNPDTYTENMEYFGPGYGAHYVDVYDSLGIKIFSHKYGGTSHNASISADGKYVFNMTCLSPEWDENLRYHFTVYKVNDGSLVYEETFENCQLDGTIGHAITEFGEGKTNIML